MTQIFNKGTSDTKSTSVSKIVRYAIKNKHPMHRSAFTYCEDELPSRIDFGKTKYGGPFTTEQVEDVKTFLRLLVITVVASVLVGQILVFNFLIDNLTNVYSLTPLSRECYRETFLTSTFEYIATAVYIPLHEFILYPALHRYFPSIKVFSVMMFDIIVSKKYIGQYGKHIICLLHVHINETDQALLSTTFNSQWAVLPSHK